MDVGWTFVLGQVLEVLVCRTWMNTTVLNYLFGIKTMNVVSNGVMRLETFA